MDLGSVSFQVKYNMALLQVDPTFYFGIFRRVSCFQDVTKLIIVFIIDDSRKINSRQLYFALYFIHILLREAFIKKKHFLIDIRQ